MSFDSLVSFLLLGCRKDFLQKVPGVNGLRIENKSVFYRLWYIDSCNVSIPFFKIRSKSDIVFRCRFCVNCRLINHVFLHTASL